MGRLTNEIGDAENAAESLRREIESGDLGADTVAALRREVERLHGEIDSANRTMSSAGSRGRLGFGQVAAGAAIATGAVLAVGAAVNGSIERLQELRQLQFRAGLEDTQGLQRSGAAFAGLGIEEQEGQDFFAEATSEFRLRLGELQAEGEQSQLALARQFGVDLESLAGLDATDQIIGQLEAVRRVRGEQGDEAARALAESLQGGVEAQRLTSIAGLDDREFQQFIATLSSAGVTSEETLQRIQELSVGFANARRPVSRLTDSITGGLSPALLPLLAWVARVANGIGDWLEENEKAATVIGVVLVTAVAALALGLGVLAVVILVGLIPAALGMATAGLAVAIAWLPITLIALGVVAGIGLLVAAGILLYQNWDFVVLTFKNGWDQLQIVFLTGADFVLAQIQNILGGLNSLAEPLRQLSGGRIDLRISTTFVDDLREQVQAERVELQGSIDARTRDFQEARAAREAEEQAGDAPRPAVAAGTPALAPAGGVTEIVEGDTFNVSNVFNIQQHETEDSDALHGRVLRLNNEQLDRLRD